MTAKPNIMQNYDIAKVVESANEVMKANSKDRKSFKESYYSLSRLLRDSQMKSMMSLTTPLFESVGLPTTGKVKPSEVLARLSAKQLQTEKDGSVSVLMWSRVQKREKDAQGVLQPVFEADGKTPVMVDKSSRIKEGSWNIDKLLRLMAQAAAFKAQVK